MPRRAVRSDGAWSASAGPDAPERLDRVLTAVDGAERRAMVRAMLWLVLLPVPLLLASMWYWTFANTQPGIIPGRGAAMVLALGALAAACVARLPAERARWWRSPVVWALAALLWQGALLLVAAPVREPGLPWLVERGAALATAVAAAAWFVLSPPRAAWALATCGAGVLIVAAAGMSVVRGKNLGELLEIGAWPPFGLVNFNVGIAVPLLGTALVLWFRERQARPGVAWHVVLALGWAAAAMLGAGVLWNDGRLAMDGDAARGVWVALVAMLAAALALLLPRRAHLPAAVGLVAAFLAIQVAAVQGLAHVGSAPSTLQRLHLWRASTEAIAAAPVAGYGPGASLDALMRQEAIGPAWLAVPSYAEAAHHEGLQALLDGGAINLALLGGALLLTLAPLWRRRGEGVPAALLVAWAGVGAASAIDVHLTQPGPLLLLALLAGASWACAREGDPAAAAPPAPRWWPVPAGLGLVAALAVVWYIRGEATGTFGTPPELDQRRLVELRRHEAARDVGAAIAVMERDRRRLGPLADLCLRQAYYERRGGAARRHEVERLALEQSAGLAIHPDQIALLQRLRAETPPAQAFDPRLAAALDEAVRRARAALAIVPENGLNRQARGRLVQVVAEEDARAQAPSAGSAGAAPGTAAAIRP